MKRPPVNCGAIPMKLSGGDFQEFNAAGVLSSRQAMLSNPNEIARLYPELAKEYCHQDRTKTNLHEMDTVEQFQ